MIFNAHVLDIVSSGFSLTSTIYSIKNNKLTWPTSLIAIVIGIFLYYQKGLYGDMGLHVVYIIMAIYGWYQWQHGGKNHSKLSITSISIKATIVLIIIALIGIFGLYELLHLRTNSNVPLWDASITIISLIADYMMCRRFIQCWFVWGFVDALFSGIYFYKNIPAHALLYAFYTTLAIIGYLNWRKKML